MNTRRAIAAAVAGSLAAAYIGAGRSRQLRWGATDEEADAALAVTKSGSPQMSG